MVRLSLRMAGAFACTLLVAVGCSSSTDHKDAAVVLDGSSDTAPAADMAAATPDMAAAEGGAADKAAGDAPGVVLTPVQERGRYLVENVIACSDCHTPRKPDGSPDMSMYLAGNKEFV